MSAITTARLFRSIGAQPHDTIGDAVGLCGVVGDPHGGRPGAPQDRRNLDRQAIVQIKESDPKTYRAATRFFRLR